MLDDTSFTVLFHRSIALECDLAILYIEILQTAAIIGDALHTTVRNHITIFQADFFQIRTAFRKRMQTGITDVTFADVQGPQTGTRMCQHGDGVIADRLTATRIQIA